MTQITLMKWLGRCISHALLGPVHVHGSPLGEEHGGPDIILVPRTLTPADCWLFWSRLRRPPVFVDKGQFANCWGYRWLSWRADRSAASDREVGEHMLHWLRRGRTLVVSVEVGSRSAVRRLERQLDGLSEQQSGLRLQLLTFNYDFKHTLGSPVHWIWRTRPLALDRDSLDILGELQALQKLAWSIKGYQTLPQLPLVSRSGTVPSTLLLSWHEVRARRRWRWPGPGAWLWLPLACLSAAVNLIPLLVAFGLGHQRQQWRIEQQVLWLGPLFLANNLVIGLALASQFGFWSLLYLPLLLLGLHPVGQLADRLIELDDNPASRTVRERMLGYFD